MDIKQYLYWNAIVEDYLEVEIYDRYGKEYAANLEDRIDYEMEQLN